MSLALICLAGAGGSVPVAAACACIENLFSGAYVVMAYINMPDVAMAYIAMVFIVIAWPIQLWPI